VRTTKRRLLRRLRSIMRTTKRRLLRRLRSIVRTTKRRLLKKEKKQYKLKKLFALSMVGEEK